ncbi:right-handed parallel beta-helix repeat-containing protein [Haloquadratum walsbyi]|uniref:Uncharacterized protein n=1 Tax=Haloquadratum walsbyi (strain DSM 16854 / JCM 12705 / C23) TaxID=768065 RepID=G0LGT9_HALWC|nr:right-handed parallel beta-helix repeat-containing protein [Haloquadratum walsbyi]CCC39641.1 uncharacterized protein Hqrw_1707 [Haloquadratum walsbyi C23]
MRRRKLLISIGALGAGGTAAFGTEAFTSVEAERNVDVNVAGDQSAFVAIQPLESSNADKYVNIEDDDTIELNLDGDNEGPGEGVNQDAITKVEDLFRVVNQGSQTASVFFEDESDAVTFRVTQSTAETSGSSGQSLESASNSVELAVGEQVVVGLTIDTLDIGSGDPLILDDVTLRADATASAPGQSIPQPEYVVDSDVFGDSDNDDDNNNENIFPTISDAVSAAESDAVIGVRSAQDIGSRITIDKPLTLSGFEGKPPIDVTASLSDDEAIAVESDDVTIQNLDLSYNDLGRDDDIHLISGINRNGITVRDLDITSNASFDTNAIDIRGVDLEIVDNTVTDAGIQVQHDSESGGGSVTISGNSVTESDSGGGGIKDEGIVAFTNNTGLGNFSYTIEDNRVRDAGTPAIKLTDLSSQESPQDVNGESDKQDQIEALLRDNDVFSARIEGSNGAQVQTTSGSTFSTIQSAVDNAAAGSQGDGVALADSGTFTESITVDDDVSLRGPNAGTPGQDSARGEEAIIDGGGPAVTLDADKAEIDGFRVEGDGSSGDVIDIPESGTSNIVRVKNNIVRTSASGSGFINGIEVVNSDPDGGVGKPASAIIEGNDIKIDTGTKGAAINALSGPNHNTITVRNNRLRGDIGGYRDIDTLTVEDNEILPASAAAPNSAMDVEGVESATFTDNTFRGDVGDLAYDDDSESTGNSNTGAATATSVLNNKDGNSGNTFDPGARVVNGGDGDGDDLIEFSND